MDRLRIEEKFDNAKKYLATAALITSEPVDLFLTSFEDQLKAERIFEVIAQIILDVCTHIVANSSEETPSSHASCIKVLEKMGIFINSSTTRFISLVKMRNLIAHQYGVIDYRLLYTGLKRLEEDFTLFRDSILSWLKEKGR